MTMTQNLRLAAFLSLLGATGVAMSAPATDLPNLDIRYDWADRENVEPVKIDACPISLLPSEDARQNKETIGGHMRGPLLSGNLDGWLNDGLASLQQFGLSVQSRPAGDTPDNGVAVRMILTRAYTWQVGIKLFSMVAVKATFTDRTGLIQEKHYRAHGDKTNMWNAMSEYVTTLNYGINNMLPTLATDLSALCKGDLVEGYTYSGPEPVVAKK